MKLVAYILVALGLTAPAMAVDTSQSLASCSNDKFYVTVTGTDHQRALVQIKSEGRNIASAIAYYELYEESAYRVLEVEAGNLKGVVEYCGSYCGPNDRGSFTYIDDAGAEVKLPTLKCKKIF